MTRVGQPGNMWLDHVTPKIKDAPSFVKTISDFLNLDNNNNIDIIGSGSTPITTAYKGEIIHYLENKRKHWMRFNVSKIADKWLSYAPSYPGKKYSKYLKEFFRKQNLISTRNWNASIYTRVELQQLTWGIIDNPCNG